LKKSLLILALLLSAASVAIADDVNSDVKAHSEAFSKGMAACDVPAVLALYEDDAIIIWPGENDEAKGKSEIEKVVTNTCKNSKLDFKMGAFEARPLGKDYIVNVGYWEAQTPGPDGKMMTLKVRTTEVLHKSGGKWRYVVDHASVGQPPPPVAATPVSSGSPAASATP